MVARKKTFWNRYGIGTKEQKVVDLIQEGACVIDVREYLEFKRGHAAGTINVPMSDIISYIGQVRDMGSKFAIVCCNDGSRARIATEIFNDFGIFSINVGSWQNASRFLDLAKKDNLEI